MDYECEAQKVVVSASGYMSIVPNCCRDGNYEVSGSYYFSAYILRQTNSTEQKCSWHSNS
jgi:hypothetical protein